MAWLKESVEAKLTQTNLFNAFIENGGFLKLQVCGTQLLFFANNDNTVSVFYEYRPSNMKIACCVDEFCSYAIPYLVKCLTERSDKTHLSSYCIKPILIDL